MATLIIRTLQDGSARYTQNVTLDGQVFVMTLEFNSRDTTWRMSLADGDNIPIQGCVGRKLVANWKVLLSVDPRRPPGELILSGPVDADPGLDELGTNQALFYIEAVDLGRSLDFFGAP